MDSQTLREIHERAKTRHFVDPRPQPPPRSRPGAGRVRLEPHNHVCAECGGLLIIARCSGERVTLDATPAIDGDYRAYLNARGDQWLANEYTPARAWLGTRRRLHECHPADVQLEIGA